MGLPPRLRSPNRLRKLTWLTFCGHQFGADKINRLTSQDALLPSKEDHLCAGPPPLIVATILRENGATGVQTHVRQLRRYLESNGLSAMLVTPFQCRKSLIYPFFGARLLMVAFSAAASVLWYRYWHELFLRKALGRTLSGIGPCVIYAQGPVEARAALLARNGPHQRVVMAVHFPASDAEGWAGMTKRQRIKRGGIAYRKIQEFERKVIPKVDGIVYVSAWARDSLLSWLPEAAVIPSAVIANFVVTLSAEAGREPIADLVTIGSLDSMKNHDFLLNVLAEAKRSGRRFTLDVFGDGPLRKALVRRTSACGLEEQVRFRGFRPDVREFLPRYKMYVHASHTETSCLAIIEAMAAGLPILAAGVGAIPELFTEGVEGWFWSLDDPAEAAAMLIRILDDESAHQKAATAASARFHCEFDAKVAGSRLWAFLQGAAPDGACAQERRWAPARLLQYLAKLARAWRHLRLGSISQAIPIYLICFVACVGGPREAAPS